MNIPVQFDFNNICSFWEPIMENVSKRFFSETTRTVETKLPRNDHWKVLYKVYVFYADRKSKMATTVGHRLTLDPMGKCSNAFFSETTNMIKAKLHPMIIPGQFGFNCPNGFREEAF
jgi:hypothetical protein